MTMASGEAQERARRPDPDEFTLDRIETLEERLNRFAAGVVERATADQERIKALEERVVGRATANQERLDEFERWLEHLARDTAEVARLGAELTRRLDGIGRTVDEHTKALENAQGSDEYVPVEALRTDLESLQTTVRGLVTTVRELVTTLRDQAQPSAQEVWERVKADARAKRKRDQVRAPIMQPVLPGTDLDRLGAGSIIVEHLPRPEQGTPLYRGNNIGWCVVLSGERVVPDSTTVYRVLYESKGAS